MIQISVYRKWQCRSTAQGEVVQADHDRLSALDAEAAALRAELAGLPAD
jgi:hypothetical protein